MSDRVTRRAGILLCGYLFFGMASGSAQVRPDSTRADSARIRLAPIRVAVTRSDRDISDVPFAVSALSGADLRAARATFGLDEALAEIPGVQVSNRYNASLDQRISVRGFGARSAFGVRGVKILLDGIPQTLPDGQGQLTNVELSSVASIQVLRGSASSLYGNASGGVIDIRTEVPDPTRTTARARALGGAFGAAKASAAVSVPVGTGSITVDGAFTRADGFRDHSESETRQVSIRLRQRPATGTNVIVAMHFADSPFLQNPGSLDSSRLATDRSQAQPGNEPAVPAVAGDRGAGKAVRQGQLGVTVQRELSPTARLDVTAFGLFRDLDNPLSFRYIGLNRRAVGFRSALNADFSGSAAPRLTVGLDLQRQRDDRLNETPDRTTVTLDQLETVMEIGPFARLSVDLGPYVTATVGGRFDNLSFRAEDRLLGNGDDSGERTMASWSGSVGAVIHASAEFSPFVNVSTSFESPTTTELAIRPSGAGGFNPDLNPTRATTVEFGVRGAASRVVYGVSAFRSRVIDALIPFEVRTDPGRRFFRNAGSANHQGVEAELGWTPTSQVAVKSAYTYSHHTFDDFRTATASYNGNRIPGIPTHQFFGSVRVTPTPDVFIAIDHTIRSTVFANDANSATVDGYGVTGLRAGYSRAKGNVVISPFVGILNVANRDYVGSAVVNAFGGRFYEPAPGRNLYAGMEVRGR